MLDILATLRDEGMAKMQRPRVRRQIKLASLPGKIDIAMGVRRCGKTYFLLQVMEDLISAGTVKESVLYINFEDDRLMPLTLEKAVAIVDGFFSMFPENHNRTSHLFLDEVHNIPDWQKLVRRLFDTKDVRLYLTGSSAKMLSSEIATNLRGRSFATEIWPYSFGEYLDAIGKTVPVERPLPRRKLDVLLQALKEYLKFGGFPELTLFEPLTKVRVLQDQHDIVVLRDVIERHGVTNISLVKYFARTLVRSAGKQFTVNKLFRDLKSQGLKVSKTTIYDYLEHFEEAYFCFPVSLYSDSLRKVQTNPRKIYAVDPGLAAAMNPDFSTNFGQLFENLVYLDLRRAGYEANYYRTNSGLEVDFLAHNPLGQRRLIQVCFNDTDPDTFNRECRALDEAQKELNIEGELITAISYLNNPVFVGDR